MKIRCVFILIALLAMSCKQIKDKEIAAIQPDKNYEVEQVIDGLKIPWGMVWLPDGSMLITEKSGALYRIKNDEKIEIENSPNVYDHGQGGLLDIALHPNYASNQWIYMTYASKEGGGKGGNTALLRCKLKENALTDIEVLYKATPNTTASGHFGSRIAFDNHGFVYFSIGDRFERDENPQDITRDGGKIYRLRDDGSIPEDNPFFTEPRAKKAIYTYGNRNPQGMVKHPETGEVWMHEHGPKGGDEINIVKKGANYGWPVVSYGINYDGTILTKETSRPNMEPPIYYWVPSIAPSGMDFVTGDNYPDWKNKLLVGSLKFGYVELLTLEGEKVTKRQKLADGIGRVRNVKMGPDNLIYIAVEGRGIFRIIPN